MLEPYWWFQDPFSLRGVHHQVISAQRIYLIFLGKLQLGAHGSTPGYQHPDTPLRGWAGQTWRRLLHAGIVFQVYLPVQPEKELSVLYCTYHINVSRSLVVRPRLNRIPHEEVYLHSASGAPLPEHPSQKHPLIFFYRY